MFIIKETTRFEDSNGDWVEETNYCKCDYIKKQVANNITFVIGYMNDGAIAYDGEITSKDVYAANDGKYNQEDGECPITIMIVIENEFGKTTDVFKR